MKKIKTFPPRDAREPATGCGAQRAAAMEASAARRFKRLFPTEEARAEVLSLHTLYVDEVNSGVRLLVCSMSVSQRRRLARERQKQRDLQKSQEQQRSPLQVLLKAA